MPNPLLKFKDRLPLAAMKRLSRRLGWMAQGLAQDFWKDGDGTRLTAVDEAVEVQKAAMIAAAVAPKVAPDGLWRPPAGEISERMWGKGYLLPLDEELTERMVRPLGVTKDMNLLDLSAGLGGHLLKPIKEFGVYINGLEADADIARRGMQQLQASGRGKRAMIEPYDPNNLTSERLYDCVLLRETLYRAADKEKFIASVMACSKPKMQLSFTDYIVNPETRDAPEIAAWRAYEAGANPVGLVEMAELWAKAGVNLRVHDDQSDLYKKEVMKGMARFAKFMATGVKPAPETKKAIDKLITTWAHRVSAMGAGMKVYRFYGLR